MVIHTRRDTNYTKEKGIRASVVGTKFTKQKRILISQKKVIL